uniref:Uncharacterized protein n=1 Tax=Anguilla anguilla TaxID=7936 RepID=A0A0E9VNJ2_ANGAN
MLQTYCRGQSRHNCPTLALSEGTGELGCVQLNFGNFVTPCFSETMERACYERLHYNSL